MRPSIDMNEMNTYLETAKVFDLQNLVEYSEGSTVSRILTKNESGNTTLFAFDQGQGLSEHTAPFDATVLIVDGKCTITIDKVEHHLQEGQVIVMPANVPHALYATEKFKMLLIMVKGKK